MKSLNQRADELRREVDDIVHQFRIVDAAAANGPHAELSCKELEVVEFLGDRGPHMMGELAEHLLVKANLVTNTIDNLEKKELVQRHRLVEDRRKIRVALTEAGQVVYTSAVEEKLRLLRTMLAALTEDEQEIFMVLMRKIARAGRSQVQKRATSA